MGLWACRCLSFVPFFAPDMQAAPALFLVAFPLYLWASVPYWLAASGALRHHRGGWSCCVPRFVGWCWASVPRSCFDSLGSIRTTGNGGKTAQKGLKMGKSKTFFEGRWCFIGIFGYPKRAKTKIFLNLRGKRWANCGLPWLRSSVAVGACIRLFGEYWRASALIVHYHTKIARFRLFGAIAFLDCLQKSVLRAF